MKRYRIMLDGQSFDVLLLSDPLQEQVQVQVNGIVFTAQVQALPPEQVTDHAEPSSPGALPASPQVPASQTTATTSRTVTAPLPGVIKSIAVRPGQRVSPGDELLVIEAMKMDNSIRASRDGTIETVLVTEGQQVGYGERLLEYVEPGPG